MPGELGRLGKIRERGEGKELYVEREWQTTGDVRVGEGTPISLGFK